MSSFPIRWNEPQPKGDLTPVKVERHDKRKKRQEALEKAYEKVDARDQRTCWVSSVRLTAGAVEGRYRLERHHLVPRSLSRQGRADPNNIITVSALAHDLITKGWIEVEGTDARKPIFFHYTESAKSKPLVIKRRNVVTPKAE